jgi:hypothetical protein
LGWGVVCCGKGMHKEEGEILGEDSRSPSHKLNIIDGITEGIILLVTPSVKTQHHRIIFFFESHYNNLCYSFSTYQQNFSVCIC